MEKKIETTKRGLPAIWECGGGMTSGGTATVVAKADGAKPRAVYVRRGGDLACKNHALVCVHDGFYIVNASVRRGSRDGARIECIVSTSVKDVDGERFEATAEVEIVNAFSEGEWDKPLDSKLEAAVEVAFRKAAIYHCRLAMYVDDSVVRDDARKCQASVGDGRRPVWSSGASAAGGETVMAAAMKRAGLL